jgi:hypothetical protein
MASPPGSKIQDFASPGSPASAQDRRPSAGTAPRLHLNTHFEEQPQSRSRGRSATSTTATAAQPNIEEVLSPTYSRSSIDTTLRRRITRSNTVRHYQSPTRATWEEPGAEPGVDVKDEEAAARFAHLRQQCEITVVDFSAERIQTYELDNDTLQEFVKRPKDDWVECRWVNVNGLDFDVISELTTHKQLHRLAIEDLMTGREQRTKVDWYSDQAFSKWDLPSREAAGSRDPRICRQRYNTVSTLLTCPSAVDPLETCAKSQRRFRQRLRLRR